MAKSRIQILRSRESLREWRAALRSEGRRLAFVPTMGALHEGHLGLVRLGLTQADAVLASIFVNPTQFAPGEDFAAYPRNEARDLELLEVAGAEAAYCPDPSGIYPPGDLTRVKVRELSDILEGAVRPHFFEGVATVVTRLFLHAAPDVAIFGEKDYQQLLVIRRMTADLGFPIDIVGAPTARDPDGLAMSSRNAYLSAADREHAGALYAAMARMAASMAAGERISRAREEASRAILEAGFASIDYVEARDAATLAPFGEDAAPAEVEGRVLVAARLGKTRLIDNAGFRRA